MINLTARFDVMGASRYVAAVLLIVGAAFAEWVGAETLTGRVVAIADGDTLTVLDQQRGIHKIRLIGIDAPEKAQPFGAVSKQHLAELVFQRDVQVLWEKKDRYGRTLGKVLLNGADVSLRQVTDGMAWWYRHYARDQEANDQGRYSEAEARAQRGRIGLWSMESPMAPWEWRRSSRR